MSVTILKTLVGSRAHKLNDEDSDFDYRSVFVSPTTDFLSIGHKPKTTSWVEGEVDDTAWEIYHFLQLATKSNPSILEVFAAPVIEATSYGGGLRALFHYVWNSTDVYHAFSGYSKNQRKKLLDDESNRANKYGVAYVRTLWMGTRLLETGVMNVDTSLEPEMHDLLLSIRHGELSKGDIINHAEHWQKKILDAYENNKDKETDLAKVNEFLISVRRNYWVESDLLTFQS